MPSMRPITSVMRVMASMALKVLARMAVTLASMCSVALAVSLDSP